MSSTTSGKAALIKPDKGEFIDGWHVPLNDNSDKVDTAVTYAIDSIQHASGSSTDGVALNIANGVVGSADALKKRLDNGLEQDGTPKPLPEVVYSRTSRMFGLQQGLFDSLAQVEQVLYWASQGQEDTGSNQQDRLRKEIARRGETRRNSIASSGDSLSVSGGVPTLQPSSVSYFNIDGAIYNIRKTTASADGALGSGKKTAFVYVEPGGTSEQQVYQGTDGVFTKSGTPAGVWNTLSSSSVGSFSDAKPGDLLRITSNSNFGSFDIGGDYIISAVGSNTITIKGGLPVPSTTTSVTAVVFAVINPWAAKLRHENVSVTSTEYFEVAPTPSSVSGRCYIGEVQWNGTSTVITPFIYRKDGVYDSGWNSSPAFSGSSPAFVSNLQHNVGLGFHPYGVVGQNVATPMKAKIFVARKNAAGHIFDVQELPFNSVIGGVTAPIAGEFGWFGYLNRQSITFVYGAKLPVGAGFGYQRKAQSTTFPNDAGLDASYETTQSNSVYRVVIMRDA